MTSTDSLHPYADPQFFERVTPLEEIAPENRFEAALPGGLIQIIDRTLAYNYDPERGVLVECGSVAGDDKYGG